MGPSVTAARAAKLDLIAPAKPAGIFCAPRAAAADEPSPAPGRDAAVIATAIAPATTNRRFIASSLAMCIPAHGLRCRGLRRRQGSESWSPASSTEDAGNRSDHLLTLTATLAPTARRNP